MKILPNLRFLWGSVLCLSASAQAKPSAAIPATSPTQSAPTATPTAVAPRAGAATVQWNGSSLSIRGNGSNLATVLREVARETGMKITGGVPDEQVFGKVREYVVTE